MTKFLKAGIFLIVSVFAPMLAVAVAAVWLLFTAPTVFGILLITGATFAMLKSVVLAASVLLIAIAALALYRVKPRDESKDSQDDVMDNVTA